MVSKGWIPQDMLKQYSDHLLEAGLKFILLLKHLYSNYNLLPTFIGLLEYPLPQHHCFLQFWFYLNLIEFILYFVPEVPERFHLIQLNLSLNFIEFNLYLAPSKYWKYHFVKSCLRGNFFKFNPLYKVEIHFDRGPIWLVVMFSYNLLLNFI